MTPPEDLDRNAVPPAERDRRDTRSVRRVFGVVFAIYVAQYAYMQSARGAEMYPAIQGPHFYHAFVSRPNANPAQPRDPKPDDCFRLIFSDGGREDVPVLDWVRPAGMKKPHRATKMLGRTLRTSKSLPPDAVAWIERRASVHYPERSLVGANLRSCIVGNADRRKVLWAPGEGAP